MVAIESTRLRPSVIARALGPHAQIAVGGRHLAIYYRQGTASLPLQTAKHYVAVEAL
jgi:hypothetical protein